MSFHELDPNQIKDQAYRLVPQTKLEKLASGFHLYKLGISTLRIAEFFALTLDHLDQPIGPGLVVSTIVVATAYLSASHLDHQTTKEFLSLEKDHPDIVKSLGYEEENQDITSENWSPTKMSKLLILGSAGLTPISTLTHAGLHWLMSKNNRQKNNRVKALGELD